MSLHRNRDWSRSPLVSPSSIMELREIEKWDVIEEYSKDFSDFFSLVSRRFIVSRFFGSIGSVNPGNWAWKMRTWWNSSLLEKIADLSTRVSYEEYMNERCSKTKRSDSLVWFINRSKFLSANAIVRLKTRRITLFIHAVLYTSTRYDWKGIFLLLDGKAGRIRRILRMIQRDKCILIDRCDTILCVNETQWTVD